MSWCQDFHLMINLLMITISPFWDFGLGIDVIKDFIERGDLIRRCRKRPKYFLLPCKGPYPVSFQWTVLFSNTSFLLKHVGWITIIMGVFTEYFSFCTSYLVRYIRYDMVQPTFFRLKRSSSENYRR